MRPVFIDVDTQMDFLFPAGALYVPGSESVIPQIQRLNQHAISCGFPLVATVDAHAEDDTEFKTWPPHCIKGTLGQRKAAATIVPGQIVVEKQEIDFYQNPSFQAALAQFEADRYVVYGVVTEYCVRSAAFGLLETGKPVAVVADAIYSISPSEGSRIISDFAARGGIVTAVGAVCGQ